jgi:hypothetical protein
LDEERCSDETTAYIWLYAIVKYFKADSEAELFLVLDGLDEAVEELQQIMDFLTTPKVEPGPGVHILMTGRPGALGLVNTVYEDSQVPVVEVTVERSRRCLRSLLSARLESLPKLSRFRASTKGMIARKMLNSNHGKLTFLSTDGC